MSSAKAYKNVDNLCFRGQNRALQKKLKEDIMRKYTVAGNWKMNGSKSSVTSLIQSIKSGIVEIDNVEWIIFPSYPFLEQAQRMLVGSKIFWGAQNFSDKPSGAYTGEVSAGMLQEFGCTHVLVGHSERRQLYGETDKIVVAKFIAAIDVGIKPILCIGETLQEREQGLTTEVIDRQVMAVLQLDNGIKLFNNAMIAYEPVWAIGTGMTATPGQAQEVHAHIRLQLSKYDAEIAKQTHILYGGSVKADNAKSLFKMADIDGGLIGGASLQAQEFLNIGSACNS
jgi:triosephosphate isomerase (TIM)